MKQPTKSLAAANEPQAIMRGTEYAITSIADRISEIFKQVDELSARLNDVLREEPPDPTGDRGAQTAISPLVDRMLEEEYRLIELRCRLKDITSRLTVG